ncbi:protein of unknown function [Sphingomonas guangdongensis]|uniref:DUF4893 domain-containing protein n=1 Tax=Sphingomonas guangdongensis TaxID=1141890 RepID=A0A285QAI6_9SPHN|nr:DUF4893 domain-containing protein [Sphingomonas guangdongensis]SOB78893.1 protein of unknown function [Sphingomonas guangdongensis]
MSARLTFPLAILLAACSGGERPAAGCADAPACTGAAPWRAVATPEDRDRLSRWRDAWTTALPAARGTDAAGIAALGPLAEPDLALTEPVPPAGTYRCRVVKLGAVAADRPGFRSLPAATCRIDADGSLTTLDGGQRAIGRIYASTDTRGVFLGALALGDEQAGPAYGADAQRDMAGFVERVAERRWRVVLPYPAFESVLDVMELVPA